MPSRKPEPVICTRVPPFEGPADGEMLKTFVSSKDVKFMPLPKYVSPPSRDICKYSIPAE
jgi:hypothetical protein